MSAFIHPSCRPSSTRHVPLHRLPTSLFIDLPRPSSQTPHVPLHRRLTSALRRPLMSPFTDPSCRPSSIPHVGLHRRPTSALPRRPRPSSLTPHVPLPSRFSSLTPHVPLPSLLTSLITDTTRTSSLTPHSVFPDASCRTFIAAPRCHHSLPNAPSSAHRAPCERSLYLCTNVCHLSSRCALSSTTMPVQRPISCPADLFPSP